MIVSQLQLSGAVLLMSGRNNATRKIRCLVLGLAACFVVDGMSSAATNETVRVVAADLQQTNGPFNTVFKRCVGAGRANEGLRADWQRQLTIVRRECGFNPLTRPTRLNPPHLLAKVINSWRKTSCDNAVVLA